MAATYTEFLKASRSMRGIPQDPWPKHVIIDSAIEISQDVAFRLGLEHKPVSEWTLREKITAAYYSTLSEERPR